MPDTFTWQVGAVIVGIIVGLSLAALYFPAPGVSQPETGGAALEPTAPTLSDSEYDDPRCGHYGQSVYRQTCEGVWQSVDELRQINAKLDRMQPVPWNGGGD